MFTKQTVYSNSEIKDFILKVLSAGKLAGSTIDISKNTSFGCIQKIIMQMYKLTPYVAYETATDVYEYQKQNPLNYIFYKPNIYNITWQSLLAQMVDAYFDTGNVLLYAPPSLAVKGAISNITLLNWYNIEPILSLSGDKIVKYKYTTNGNTSVYDAGSCIHIKDLRNSKTDASKQYLVGTPSYKLAVSDLIHNETEIYKFYSRLLKNDGKDMVALMSSQRIEENVIDKLRARWRQVYGDNMEKQVIALEQGLNITNIPSNSQLVSTLTGSNTSETIEKQVCAIFQVPYPIYNGEFSGVTNNSSIMLQSFYDTVDTIYSSFEAHFTEYFKKFDEKAVLWHEKIRAEDIKAKSEVLTMSFNRGQLTINQMNEMLGYPVINEKYANTNFIPMGYTPIETLLAETVIPTEIKNIAKSDFFEREDDDFFLIWKQLDQPYQKFQKKYLKEITSVFKVAEKQALENVDKLIIKSLGTKADLVGEATLIDVSTLKKLLSKSTLDTRSKMIIEAILITLEQTGIGYTSITDEYAEIISKSLLNSSTLLATSIDTLDEELKTLVKNTVQNADVTNPVELQKKISEAISSKFNTVTPSRVKTISTTTTTNLVNNTYKQTHKELGFDSQWVSQRDGQVRYAHEVADGQVANGQGMFNVGGEMMQYPASGARASNNVNCRCYIKSKKRKKVS